MRRTTPVIQLDDILLRPWKVGEAAWYVKARDEEVFKWTTEDRDLTVHKAKEGIRQANEREDAYCFAIVDNDTRQLMGNIALMIEAGDIRSGEIMCWLAPQGRGRGIATRALRQLCRWAFDRLGLERVTAKILVGNDRSLRLAERVGFRPLRNGGQRTPDSRYKWYVVTGETLR